MEQGSVWLFWLLQPYQVFMLASTICLLYSRFVYDLYSVSSNLSSWSHLSCIDRARSYKLFLSFNLHRQMRFTPHHSVPGAKLLCCIPASLYYHSITRFSTSPNINRILLYPLLVSTPRAHRSFQSEKLFAVRTWINLMDSTFTAYAQKLMRNVSLIANSWYCSVTHRWNRKWP